MGVIAYSCLSLFDDVFNMSTGLGVFLQGFISGMIGISFGIFVLSLLKNEELADLVKALSHKFWRSRFIAPEQSDL